MPAYLTHKLASQAALAIIDDDEIKRIITENQTEYLSGAQGTDFVYFSHYYFLPISAKTKVYGWLVHRARPSEYLVRASQYLKTHYSEKLMAYFFGFLTHYCLDKYLHPLVSADAPTLSKHTYLEQALDVMYAKDFFQLDATQLHREKELLSLISNKEEMNAFHRYMAAANYDGYRLRKHVYEKSYWWWAKVMRHTDQPSKIERFFLRIFNNFLAFDIVAFIYKPAEEILDQYDYPKYYRAISKANNESVQYMKTVFEFIQGKHHVSVLESMIFNVNCMGKCIVPWEDRYGFRRALRRAPTIK